MAAILRWPRQALLGVLKGLLTVLNGACAMLCNDNDSKNYGVYPEGGLELDREIAHQRKMDNKLKAGTALSRLCGDGDDEKSNSKPPGANHSQNEKTNGTAADGVPAPLQAIVNVRFDSAMGRVKTFLDGRKRPAVVPLPRGGSYVTTRAGAIQFGIPPETIKDCMRLDLPLPAYYVVPKTFFNRRAGVFPVEFEFPAYFNFFIMRGQVNLILRKKQETVIRRVFQETLFGPENPYEFMDIEKGRDVHLPDLGKEMEYYRRHPFRPGEMMSTDTLVGFRTFDEHTGSVTIGKPGQDVTVTVEGDEYVLREDGQEVARVPDFVDLPSVVPRNDDTIRAGKMFDVPAFGATLLGSSHGFDPWGSTTGFVLWMNGRGIMVDPPPNSGAILRREGIPSRLVDAVILTHCHADHDAGIFQKIMEEGKISFFTTPTIMASFLRKYSSLSGFSETFVRSLFTFRPAVIGEPLKTHGGSIKFHYNLHAIPCVGFQASFGEKTLVYSGDTNYDPPRINTMTQDNVMTPGRRDALLAFPWDSDLILHEAGVPPIHTEAGTLAAMPEDVKDRMYCVHVARQNFPFDRGLRIAACGVDNTIRVPVVATPEHKMVDMLDVVSQCILFRGLDSGKVMELYQAGTEREFGTGEMVVTGGDRGETLYVVQRGAVERYKGHGGAGGGGDAAGGAQSHRQLLVAGDFFGEEALFGEGASSGAGGEVGGRHTSDVRALCKTTVLCYHWYDLQQVLLGTEIDATLQRLASLDHEPFMETIASNFVLGRMSDSQKRQLSVCVRGVAQHKAKDQMWTLGGKISMCCVVKSGSVAFAGQGEEAFSSGAFVGEVDGLMGRRRVPLTEGGNGADRVDPSPVSRSPRKPGEEGGAAAAAAAANGGGGAAEETTGSAANGDAPADPKFEPRAPVVVAEPLRHKTSLVATAACELYVLDGELLKAFLENNPGILINLLGSVFVE